MPYTQDYELALLRGIEEPRPWDLAAEVLRHVDKSDRVLDVGCGTCTKLKTIAPHAQIVFGLDPNPEMLKRASENIQQWGVSNLHLVRAKADRLPFPDGSLNIVTSMVAVHDTQEVARVLGPNGIAVVEKLGDRDKWNLKLAFGSDEYGPRGFLSELPEGARIDLLRRDFGEHFADVKIVTGKWKTYFSLEGFTRLCEQVSLIRDFDRVRDSHILTRIEREFMTPQGIETSQQRILIIARGVKTSKAIAVQVA
jgi:SAM-dependent methyltransferase